MKLYLALLFFVLVLVLTIYALIRERLKVLPLFKPFFAWVEPIEATLWLNSKTILFARLKMATGIVLAILTATSNANLASVLAPVLPLMDASIQGWVNMVLNLLPLLLTVIGFIDEHLRKITDKPIELAEVTQAEAAAQPALQQAVATHEEVTNAVVATVEAVKG